MDIYYQLVDRDTSTIKAWWKGLHIFSFIIVIISGFITAYALGRSNEAFGDNCILFAKISFLEHNTTKNQQYGLLNMPPNITPIDIATSEWGSVHLFYFCQFTPLMCMISAVIWIAFFIMCSKGGAGYITDTVYGSWRIVYPALVFTAVANVAMLISSLNLHEGIQVFCAQFKNQFGTARCTSAIDDYTLSFFKMKRPFIVLLKIALSCSYICFAGWVLQLATLILRIVCIVDFQLIKITVTPIIGEEELQKVINPDENSDDTVLMSVKQSTDIPKNGRRFPFMKNKFPHFGRKKSPMTVVKSAQSKPSTITVASRPSQPLHEGQRVSFIDESPTTEDTDTVASLNSLEQKLLLSKMPEENTNDTATTSFSLDKKAGSTPAGPNQQN